MFLIHPIFQTASFFIAVITLILGINRFKYLHLGKKVAFKWNLHVKLGIMATTIWLIGGISGIYISKKSWGGFFITGAHGIVGVFMIPLICFALISGMIMDKKKKKRKVLPAIHGISNLIMVTAAIFQIYSGIVVYLDFVLGV